MNGGALLGAGRVRELLSAHDVMPKKSLGQNFVIDPNTIRKVVTVARLDPSDRVLEIGAGCGSLTLGLAAVAAHVDALEVDRRLLPILEEVVRLSRNVTVHHGDALEVDLNSFGARVVVANLPYNIAASVVLRVLEAAPAIDRLAVMTQKEVGERLASGPGSKIYGQTSVLVAYFGTAEVAAPISRRAFFPVPGVDSVLVKIERNRSSAVPWHRFATVVKTAFGQRRKNLRNALATLAGSLDAAEAALHRAGIDPRARAEEIGLEGFEAIAGGIE